MAEPQILVIGSGLAGLALALDLAERGLPVQVLSKGPLDEGSTRYAQGGIAAVQDADDSFAAHIKDTLSCGAGLCDEAVVERIITAAPQAIDWLVERGVQFNRSPENGGGYHLAQEGGHSFRRILHSHDATGAAIARTLQAQAARHTNIQLLEGYLAIDLISSERLGLGGPKRCVGVYALETASQQVRALPCTTVVLATGGASKIYLYTSNPDTSTGDGIAMAWRAGCRIANLEFVQFHPTCLYHPAAKSFLISEAVRGEGGHLLLPGGHRFMPEHDSRAELAPRDIVARSIDYEMKKHGLDNVFLDLSHRPADFIREHFPTIHRRCLNFGLDMTQTALPVVPAAHYTCGGVLTDAAGLTDLPNVYALGETGCTGLHGANRLASNSLLECLIVARAAAERIAASAGESTAPPPLPAWDESRVSDADESVVVAHNWDELRRAMWDYVGIVRTDKRLQRALNRVQMLKEEIREFYHNFRISRDLIELRNLVEVAELTVKSAAARKESRGLHFTLDYPERVEKAENTVLINN